MKAVGQGTAWLLFDAGGDLFQYQCYWYGGSCGDHLLDHARTPAAADAVEWATARTPRARIRLPDHRTYWAGTAPDPGGFAGTWPPQRRETAGPSLSEQVTYVRTEATPVRIRDTVSATR